MLTARYNSSSPLREPLRGEVPPDLAAHCKVCDTTFANDSNLRRHLETIKHVTAVINSGEISLDDFQRYGPVTEPPPDPAAHADAMRTLLSSLRKPAFPTSNEAPNQASQPVTPLSPQRPTSVVPAPPLSASQTPVAPAELASQLSSVLGESQPLVLSQAPHAAAAVPGAALASTQSSQASQAAPQQALSQASVLSTVSQLGTPPPPPSVAAPQSAEVQTPPYGAIPSQASQAAQVSEPSQAQVMSDARPLVRHDHTKDMPPPQPKKAKKTPGEKPGELRNDGFLRRLDKRKKQAFAADIEFQLSESVHRGKRKLGPSVQATKLQLTEWTRPVLDAAKVSPIEQNTYFARMYAADSVLRTRQIRACLDEFNRMRLGSDSKSLSKLNTQVIAARVLLAPGEGDPTKKETKFVRSLWKKWCDPAYYKWSQDHLNVFYTGQNSEKVPRKKGRKRTDSGVSEDDQNDEGGQDGEDDDDEEGENSDADNGNNSTDSSDSDD